MALLKLSLLFFILVIVNQCSSTPGHHVHHRIHVPTKVKTIYHTKIIKVPEHHHYIHEKEKPKLIKIPEHHHYFHEKEKEKYVDLHNYHQEEDHGGYHSDFHDYENEHHKSSYEYDDGHHQIFKKHAPIHQHKKKRVY